MKEMTSAAYFNHDPANPLLRLSAALVEQQLLDLNGTRYWPAAGISDSVDLRSTVMVNGVSLSAAFDNAAMGADQ